MTTEDKEGPAAAFRRAEAILAAAIEEVRTLLMAHGYVAGAEVRRKSWEKEYKLTSARVSSILFISGVGHYRLKSGGWSKRRVSLPGDLTDYEVFNSPDPPPMLLERAPARAEPGGGS